MHKRYEKAYKDLLTQYYSDAPHSSFYQLASNYCKGMENPSQAREILAALCGVECPKNLEADNFAQLLEAQVTKGKVKDKIVLKLHSCTTDCEQVEGKSSCQRVCPFDAIIKDEFSNEKWIDPQLCMSCGRCISICDKGNYLDIPQFLPLAQLLEQHEKVIAIVAPAIAGQFGTDVSLDQLREAFIKIGFTDMVEVALAADILSIKEAYEFNEHVSKTGDFMITSCCCPMWVAALRKVYQKIIPDVSPSVSPMIAMGRVLKSLDEQVKVVFVGPCIAKKAEAREKDLVGAVDFVLTFEETQLIFEALHVKPETLQGVPSMDYASTGGRLYGRTGGVSRAVKDIVESLFPEKESLFTALQVDGMKSCKQLLEEVEAGKVSASFIEGMGCQGGCVGGPKAIIATDEGKRAVEQRAYESAIKVPVYSEVLIKLLAQLGVEKVSDLKEGHSLFERSFEIQK